MNVHEDDYPLKVKPFFSSAPDIVSGAYPMPSRPASVNYFFQIQ